MLKKYLRKMLNSKDIQLWENSVKENIIKINNKIFKN